MKMKRDNGRKWVAPEWQGKHRKIDDLSDGEMLSRSSREQYEREKRFDFAHQTGPGGLQIMVPHNSGGLPFVHPMDVIRVLGSPMTQYAFLLFFGALILKWLDNKSLKDGWWGIHAICSTIGWGDVTIQKFIARVFTVFIWFGGTVVTGQVIAGMTSLTLHRLQSGGIQSTDDLKNRVVVTVDGSSSVDALHKIGAVVKTADNIDDAYAVLLAGDAKALVFDSSTLKHIANTKGAGKVSVVGPVFEKQYYGLALPEGSDLREPFNRSLQKMRQNGEYDRIWRKWFGS